MKPTCKRIQAYFQEGRLSSGQLPPGIEAHVNLCLVCQEEWESHARLCSVVEGVASDVLPSVTARMLAAHTIALSQQRQRPRPRLYLVPAAACAALLCSAFSWQLYTSFTKGADTPKVQLSAHPPSTRAIPPQGTSQRKATRHPGENELKPAKHLPSGRRTFPEKRVKMVWPSHHIFIISRARKKRHTNRQPAIRPKKS